MGSGSTLAVRPVEPSGDGHKSKRRRELLLYALFFLVLAPVLMAGHVLSSELDILLRRSISPVAKSIGRQPSLAPSVGSGSEGIAIRETVRVPSGKPVEPEASEVAPLPATHAKGSPVRGVAFSCIMFALFYLVAAWLITRRRYETKDFIPISFFAVLASHGIGMGPGHLLHQSVPGAWSVLLSTAVMLAGLVGVARLRHVLTGFRTLRETTANALYAGPGDDLAARRKSKVLGARALVLFVSSNQFSVGVKESEVWVYPASAPEGPPRAGNGAPQGGAKAPLGGQIAAGRQGGVRLSGDIKEDIRDVAPEWNWQQLLRAIQPHVDRDDCLLERVWLLGSKDTPQAQGSGRQIADCILVLKKYLKNVQFDSRCDLDFFSMDEVIRVLVHDVLPSLKRQGCQSREIVIDVTGGTKTSSIAGAIVTLNDDMIIQYVETKPSRPPEKGAAKGTEPATRVYDVRNDPLPQLE